MGANRHLLLMVFWKAELKWKIHQMLKLKFTINLKLFFNIE
jgi:hypothetical protein